MQRVLVIDDEPDALRGVMNLLREVPGCEVHGALSFDEGRDLALGEPWSAIVADQQLRGQGLGAAILAEVQRAGPREPRTRLILMTAFELGLEGLPRDLRLDALVEKPFDPEDLLAVVAGAR